MIAVMVFVFGLGAVILKGIVVQSLWSWFIVPLGVVSISVPHAIGISTIVSLFNTKIDIETNDDEDRAKQLFVSIFFILLVWGIGAIVNLWM